MIDLRELAKYQYNDDEIKVTCTDGKIITGQAGEVDDEEESGLGEPGITIYMKDGGWIGIGLSEIDSISVLSNSEKLLVEA